jgi:hypothetical protein
VSDFGDMPRTAGDVDRDAKPAMNGAASDGSVATRFTATTHFLTRKSVAARNDFEILRS